MKKLCLAPNIAIAQLWKDALAAEGIIATVQRHYASSIAGDIPPDQALPELWVMEEAQHEHALRLIRQLQHAPIQRWTCVACGEVVEGAFESCWQCGEWKPT